jgi:hypothetical protein
VKRWLGGRAPRRCTSLRSGTICSAWSTCCRCRTTNSPVACMPA